MNYQKRKGYKFFITTLPEDIVKLITLYCDPDTDYYRDKIKKICNDNNISSYGYNYKYKYRTDDMVDKTSICNILRCMNEAPYIFKPLKTVYKTGSYGGKHSIEIYRRLFNDKGNNYISNGEFIVAMILLGYKYKKYDNSPNFVFRCSSLLTDYNNCHNKTFLIKYNLHS